ncbi:hypothetical protein RZE82_00520 [Mollicutes bacterium LVI A0039]|nr:hypothetical protein RZE82_00520 [Mollicutes bacterium LVI A0039]
MQENNKIYEIELLDYYTELLKNTYLKDNLNLGINARNKVTAQYNRLTQEEKVTEINSLVTRIGNEQTLATVSTAAYINTVSTNTRLLNVYSIIKIYVAIKAQFLNEVVDPLHIIATFDPTIWKHENIQDYANAALEYNRYQAMLLGAMNKINEQTKINLK